MNDRYFNYYFDKIAFGEDWSMAVVLNRKESNDYRKNHAFHMKLMNTTYMLSLAKSCPSTCEGYDELFLTNLTPAEFSLEGLKEEYIV